MTDKPGWQDNPWIEPDNLAPARMGRNSFQPQGGGHGTDEPKWDRKIVAIVWAIKTDEPLFVGLVGSGYTSDMTPDEIKGVIGWLEKPNSLGMYGAKALSYLRKHQWPHIDDSPGEPDPDAWKGGT